MRASLAAAITVSLVALYALAGPVPGTTAGGDQSGRGKPTSQPTTTPIKLTWDDLLIRDIPKEDAVRCLRMWGHLLEGQVAPIGVSRFGDWYLRRPDGSTIELSVLEGTSHVIADTPERFAALLNDQTWQEDHLLSLQVYELHRRGTVPGPRQCYALVPHPRISGKIIIDGAMVMDLVTWQTICSQLDAQIRGRKADPGDTR